MNAQKAFLEAQKAFKEKNIASASLDAEVLLLASINLHKKIKRDKSWLYINYKDYELSNQELENFKKFINRRKKYEPVAYILGKKEFYGLDFLVNKNVLIPRNETEAIVETVSSFIKNHQGSKFILIDIGTGSGCIPVSILSQKAIQKKIAKTYANDISEQAIETAKSNAQKHKMKQKISFLHCDFSEAINKIPDHKNIIITANLPYISEDSYKTLSPTVKEFEPKLALTADKNGLDKIERLIKEFGLLEKKFENYMIILEMDPWQISSAKKYIAKNIKKAKIEIIKDIRGKKRFIKIYKN